MREMSEGDYFYWAHCGLFAKKISAVATQHNATQQQSHTSLGRARNYGREIG